jgi:ribokinase
VRPRPRLVVVGSCNIDLVATGPRLPGPGETVLCGELITVPGGKGSNQAIAAARAGAACRLLAAVGAGEHGDLILSTLAAAGVDCRQVRRVAGPSGTALIMVGAGGENLIAVVPGANSSLVDLTAEERATIEGAALVLLQLEIPITTVTEAAVIARRGGATVVLNVAPPARLPSALMTAVDVLVANEHEAAVVAGSERGAEESARLLLSEVPAAVITLGPAGAVYLDRSGEPVRVPAPAVSAIDTTAAGDTFVGFLAVALAEQRPIRDALQRACAAASISVERLGASASIPTSMEMEARLQSVYSP